MANPQRFIDAKNADCRSTDGCQSCQRAFVPRKMFGPFVSSRVKQRMQDIRLGVVPRRIWPFVQTARSAAECKVLDDRGTRVFLRANVVEMERARIEILRKLAVFTTTACSFPNMLSSRRRHIYSVSLLPKRLSDNRAFA